MATFTEAESSTTLSVLLQIQEIDLAGMTAISTT
jgi:hypothetical protein